MSRSQSHPTRAASTSAFLVFLLLAWAGLSATTPALAAGPIVSGEVASGAFTAPTYSETWTFSGTNGNRVLIAAVTTSGAANTVIRLKNPSNVEVVTTASDRVDYQLLATGTYTLVIEDSGLNDAGTYNVSLLNVTAGPLTSGPDPDGGAIASAQVLTGQTNAVCDFDAFTFSGTAGDRILFAALATAAAPYNTTLYLYPPGGGAAETSTGGGDRMDWALAATGTYTVVVEDSGNDHTGNYSISLLNVTAGPLTNGSDPDGGTITSAEIKSAAFSSTPDFDAWKFTGTAGDRVILSAVNTVAGSQNTVTYLYPPAGSPVIATGNDRNEYQLAVTGTYTIVVEDSGQNETGAYNLSLLNLTAGPLSNGTDPDGGAIASAQVLTGQTNAVCDFDAFTFSGTAGDRILFASLATTGAPYNTTLYLYPPGGGAAETSTGGGDRMDWALATTGTYTVVIEDSGNDHTGNYSISLLNVTAGPLTNGSDPDGGTITSAEIKSAAFSSTPDFDAWKFTGTAGDRVILSAVNTAAGAQNTVTYLYPPTGSPVIATGNDRNEYQLAVTGTYTIVVEDSGQNETGAYNLSLLNLTAGPLSNGTDPDGGAIASAQVLTGQTNAVCDFDAFTFSGTAGDRILFAALATAAAPYNTTLYLYPPGGGAAETSTGGGDRMDWALATTGTYTVVVEDSGNDHTGSYSVSYLNVTAGPLTNGSDPDGGTITSAEIKSAAFSSTPDFDAWKFTGTAGDRVILSAVNTAAGSQNTVTYLYPPAGSPVIATGNDRNEYQLAVTGTYTIVVEDSGQNETGAYNLSLLNLTAGPLNNGTDPDGGAIASAQVLTGQTNAVCDFDAFTFSGTAGDRILFAALATAAAPYNTTLYLYPPGGGAAETSTGGGDRMDWALATTGTYTVVVEDSGNDHTGSYSVSFLNVTAGPLNNGSDPDGGFITSAEIKSAAFSSTPDFDAWKFEGTAGDRVILSAVNTAAGSQNTVTYLYPPAGSPVIATGNDRNEYQLAVTGTYTIVVEDSGQNETGAYNLSLLNLTAGPYKNLTDPDGGTLNSAASATGQSNAAGDFDVFAFLGNAGDRVLFAALATTGAPYNTTLTLYPPGGGAAETSTGGGDRLDWALGTTGMYIVVVEDLGMDHTGSYAVSHLNVTNGPLASPSDPDGAYLIGGESIAGTISPAPDFDGFRFTGSAGQSVQVTAVATSGPINTTIYIYPPNGGSAVVATATDNVNYTLTATGTYAIVIEDSADDETGTYNLTYVGPGDAAGAPDVEEFDRTKVVTLSPFPNPFARSATLSFSIPAELPVRVRIFDATGAKVRTLADGTLPAGRHRLEWDGRDDQGNPTASGIYYIETVTGRETARQKLVRVR